MRRSTGGAFVLPICVGTAIGRFGCLFAGLADYTYGVPTTLPRAGDLGDGIGRNPVEIYEAALWPATWIQAAMVSGLIGDPLRPLALMPASRHG